MSELTLSNLPLDGSADHSLAARFLYRFIDHQEDIAWLSSYHRKGGLVAVDSDVNGCGVGLRMLLELTKVSE